MQLEDLIGGQPGLVPEELGQVADLRADGSVAEGSPKDAARAPGGSGQAQQQLDRGRLARTVRPEETDELAAPDGQAEPVEGGRAAKGLDDPVELDRGRRGTDLARPRTPTQAGEMVEMRGLEPLTPAMRTRCSSS